MAAAELLSDPVLSVVPVSLAQATNDTLATATSAATLKRRFQIFTRFSFELARRSGLGQV